MMILLHHFFTSNVFDVFHLWRSYVDCSTRTTNTCLITFQRFMIKWAIYAIVVDAPWDRNYKPIKLPLSHIQPSHSSPIHNWARLKNVSLVIVCLPTHYKFESLVLALFFKTPCSTSRYLNPPNLLVFLFQYSDKCEPPIREHPKHLSWALVLGRNESSLEEGNFNPFGT